MSGYAPHEFLALAAMVEFVLGRPASLAQAPSPLPPFEQHSLARVTLGCAVFLPSDGRLLCLRNAPDHAPLAVQLPLRRDDVSSLLNPRPLLQAEPRSPAAASASPADSVNNLDFLKHQQGPSSLDSFTRLELDEALFPEGLLLAFDLRALHPDLGALGHGEDIRALLGGMEEEEDPQPPVRRRADESPRLAVSLRDSLGSSRPLLQSVPPSRQSVRG